MANYCRDCSIRRYGRDFGDLAKLTDQCGLKWVVCDGCEDLVRPPYILVGYDGARRRYLEKAIQKAWGKQNPQAYRADAMGKLKALVNKMR